MKKVYERLAMMLTIAAILMAGFSACSADDATENMEQPTEPRKIHVTVGAGLGNDETRSEVVMGTNSQTGKTTRTLTFTEGDRLYVIGDIDDTHRMGGYLTLVSGAGTTSAMFSGDFTVWEYNGSSYVEDTDYASNHSGNPMEWYNSNPNAYLFHKDIVDNGFSAERYAFGVYRELITALRGLVER